MELRDSLPKKDPGASKSPEHRSVEELVRRMKSELCEDWLQNGVDLWRPTKLAEDGRDLPPSWTGTITTKVGDDIHYITCPGYLNGAEDICTGRWCRKDRQAMAQGLHCVYGGWVFYNGDIITEVHPTPPRDDDDGGRNLSRLRRLWAEHVLSPSSPPQGDEANHLRDMGGIVVDQDVVDQVHELMERALARRMEKIGTGREKKTLGKGTGGWSGLTENGTVLKRDPGTRRIANYEDRTDAEPGGMWERGDVEVWMTWNGWSCFVTRDGRWRPGYHLEILVSQWLTVVDYGLTRALFRDWQAGWLQMSEWVLVNGLPDMPRRFAELFGSDVREMIRRETLRSGKLEPEKYLADDASTRARRYQCLQDRGGNAIALHTVGEAFDSPRGLVATWCMAAINDLVDYERDVLCGETNNIARSLSSDQQVVDTAACALEAVWWSLDNRDYDLTDAILGSATLYLVMWRYNGPKLARYKPISLFDQRPGVPPEIKDIVEIVRPGGGTDGTESYGQMYTRTEAKVRKAYDGCTCSGPTEGHDAWKILAQAMDEAGNDDLEERLQVACVALNNSANSGDLKSECAVDLLLLESFVRTFHPETGLVARLHYRSDNTQYGNTITE